MKSSKTVVYSVRLSHKDTRAWRKAAIREQVTLAHFLRDALRKRAGGCARLCRRMHNMRRSIPPDFYGGARLFHWRERVLSSLEREAGEALDDYLAAEDGLDIARRNCGEVADDVVDYLQGKLARASRLVIRIEKVREEIMEMDLAELSTLFAKTDKLKTWEWQKKEWHLAS